MVTKKELLWQAFCLFRLGNKIHEKQSLLNDLYNPCNNEQSPECMKVSAELDNLILEFTKLELKYLEYRTSFISGEHKEVIV